MVTVSRPSGGRVRRRGGAVSLASADVPAVAPVSDPGARVPSIRVPQTNVLGEGLQVLGAALDTGSEALLRIVQRREGLARDADDTSYSSGLSGELRDLQSSADLSDEAVVTDSLKRMSEERDRILSEHKGSASSRAALEDRLNRRLNSFNDSLAVMNIQAADQRLNKTLEGRINANVQEVLKDPAVLVSEDPLEAFRTHSAQLDDDIEFIGLRPNQARLAKTVGRSEILTTMITSLINSGQPEHLERGKAILRSEEVAELVPPEVQRDAAQRIANFEQKLTEGRLTGEAQMSQARALLGPSATEDQVRTTAKRLAGLSEDKNYKFFEVGGNIVGIDENTGKVIARIPGPTAEEEARREGAKERAKLMARADVLRTILSEAGFDPAAIGFDPEEEGGEGTGSAGGGEPSGDKPTKPTSNADRRPEDAGGERARSLATPAQQAAAINTPFGPDVQASADAKSFSRLVLASRRLLLVGETELSNALLGHARFLAENSAEMRVAKELDMPILSLELARELGVPLGTKFRDVLGFLPKSPEQIEEEKANRQRLSTGDAALLGLPLGTRQGDVEGVVPPSPTEQSAEADRSKLLTTSEASELGVPFGTTRGEASAGGVAVRSPEDRARSLAAAGALGREEVKQEEQIAFIQEARVPIVDLLEELEVDPTLVGAVGALRATGRSAVTILQDIGMTDLIDNARNLAIVESELGFDTIQDMFDDPTLSVLDIIQNTAGMIVARLFVPEGRIPVDVINRSVNLVNLKGTRGSQAIKDRLNFVLDFMDRRQSSILRRFPNLRERMGMPAEEVDDEQELPRFRIEGGKLVPVAPQGGALGGGTSDRPFQ